MQTRFRLHIQILILLGLGLLLVGFSPRQQADPNPEELNVTITQVDTSQFPEVTVYVSVTDAAGEPVGVDPAGMRLEENGAVILPDQINGSGPVSTLTTMLVMDVSGSMNSGGKLEAAKTAAQAYVEQIRSGDKAGLLVFNTSIDLVQAVTKNQEALIAAIKSLRARDDTAMYDALGEAVALLEPVEGRKAMIVLTDGLDNRSSTTAAQVLELIGPAGLSISTIGLGDPTHGKGAQTALDEHALIALAGEAGGVYEYAEDEEALSELYGRYGRALQAEYRLTYASPAALRDGVNRSLSISFESASAQIGMGEYNPGGLVPETAETASWSLFFRLLGGLVVLLFVPFVVRMVVRLVSGKENKKASDVKLSPRIKLKD
jgi:Ca-activated chloride channel family protein